MGYVLVRIFLREEDRLEGKLAYRRLIELIREEGVRGATVQRSIMGYGTTGEYHYEGIEVLSYGLPVVVEFVEEEDKALAVLQSLTRRVRLGLILVEEVRYWSS
ncbi:MAG: DUF190 domain-containing protein [Aquificaceae bacterium]|nr:DUF190 domain-containing protein [Aquificaceae bacterium]MCX7989348.1 DUF190 domain-containing protein [Aquificaceae bacterium]